MVEKEHSPLENSPGHGNAQICVFRHQGAFWAEYFVFLCHMGLIIFQRPYPEKIINKIGGHECPWGAHKGRRQSSGRETWAKLKSHQIRSNGTVPSPPNQFLYLFVVYIPPNPPIQLQLAVLVSTCSQFHGFSIFSAFPIHPFKGVQEHPKYVACKGTELV